METPQESRTRSGRNVRNPASAPPVRRRSLRHILQPPAEQSSTVFNPSDPYSSAMDNVPLKDLFPNMKVRKRQALQQAAGLAPQPVGISYAQQAQSLVQALPTARQSLPIPPQQLSQVKKADSSDIPSPKPVETDDSVRCKLRDSLTAALRMVDNIELRKDVNVENQSGDGEQTEDVKIENVTTDGVQTGDVKMENQTGDVEQIEQTENVKTENMIREGEQTGDVKMENPPKDGEEIGDVKMENLTTDEKQTGDVKMENPTSNREQIVDVKMENLTTGGEQIEEREMENLTESEPNAPSQSLENSEGLIEKEKDKVVSGIIDNPIKAEEASPSEQGNVDQTESESLPCKKPKLDSDSSNQKHSSDVAEKIAVEIEAELYRHFCGVNKKYKEKARSLLFNLKDRSNPELRSRVLSGEITPENLCNMNAEQLASKELSEWRMAKAEELAHMIVLTDQDAGQARLVKKTHKGEVEVTVERDDILPEVLSSGSQQRASLASKQEPEETAPAPVVERTPQPVENRIMGSEADMGKPEVTPLRELLDLASGISSSANVLTEKSTAENLGDAEKQSPIQLEKDPNLPSILSLDEYMGIKKEKESKLSIKGDELELKLGCSEITADEDTSKVDNSLTNVKDKSSRKTASPTRKSQDIRSGKNVSTSQKDKKKDSKTNEKLWEGSFQLSGSQISPMLAIYKSGDTIDLQSWPKQIEIKGRVRLDALDKFLHELKLSRTRAIMIVAWHVDGGKTNATSGNALKEAAYQYNKGERVGYAEPLPGYELYLFPGGGNSLKMLVEHGYLQSDQISEEEEGILMGFIVCRRSQVPNNTHHKSSSQYFNANRHAISAQLDSPTRPNETQWAGSMVPTSSVPLVPLQHSSKETENKKSSVSFANPQKAGLHSNTNMPNMHDPRSGSKSKPEWLHRDVKNDDDNNDDLPPGFAPKPSGVGKRSFEDDDDLPEYDFSSNFSSAKLPEVPVQFHAVGPRPPPGLPPGPLPYSNLPPRTQLPADASFSVGAHAPRASADTSFSVRAHTPHAEPSDAFGVNQSPGSMNENILDQRSRTATAMSPAQNHTIHGAHSNAFANTGKSGSLWDDDDMPEWCPPTLGQPEPRHVPPCPPPIPIHESLPPRGMLVPPASRGWQRMPPPPMPSLPPPPPLPPSQLSGMGMPPMRFPGPVPSVRGMHPLAQVPPYRNQNIRPLEQHPFRTGK